MLLGLVQDGDGHGRDAVALIEHHRVERLRVGIGKSLEHFGRDDATRRIDLAVLAVESDLETAGLPGDVAPAATHAEVDFAHEPFRGVEAPPAPDQLGSGPSPEDEAGGSVELALDEDLAVGWEGDGGRAIAVAGGAHGDSSCDSSVSKHGKDAPRGEVALGP